MGVEKLKGVFYMSKFGRILSLILVVAMLVQLLPASVFAQEIRQVEEDLSPLQGTENVVENPTSNANPEDILYEVEEYREEAQKHFRMKDGSFVAVQYDQPVHYENSDGNFVEIDNSLQAVTTQEGTPRYRSVNGGNTTEFAASLADNMLFTVSWDGSSVGMGLLQEDNLQEEALQEFAETLLPADLTVQAQVESVTATRAANTSASFYPKNLGETVLYEDVYPNVDLLYEAYSYNIKESIILNASVDQNTFVFSLNLQNLTPQAQEDGSILLLDTDSQPTYKIPAPYMYDAQGSYSDAVTHTLTPVGEGQYYLTVTADQTFLDEATYPVCIDPTLEKVSTNNTSHIRSTYITSGQPNKSYEEVEFLYAGYSSYKNDGNFEMIVYAGNLPQIPDGCLITGAQINLRQFGYSTDSAENYMLLQAHQLTLDKKPNETYANFIDRLTWNTVHPNGTANYDSTVLDFAKISYSTNKKWISLDITEQCSTWYKDKIENRCLLLRTDTHSAKRINAQFYNYRDGISFLVSYRNDVGLESYYTYRTLGAGRAGTVAISDHTHRVTLGNTLIDAPSNVMPFSMSLVYNSSQGTRYFTDNKVEIHARDYRNMKIGAGWKLTAQQCVQSVRIPDDTSNTLYWVYTDEDGTEHYFMDEDENGNRDGVYKDEDGLGYTASLVDEPGHTNFKIETETGYQMFFRDGILTWEKDAYGNGIYYCYNGNNYHPDSTEWQPSNTVYNRLTQIYRYNNGSTKDPELLAKLDYYTGNETTGPKDFLWKITNEAGLIATLSYETESGVTYLSSVTYPDSKTSYYDYTDGLMTDVYDAEGNYGFTFAFNGAGQIQQYQEYYKVDPEANTRQTGATVSCWNGAGKRCTYRDWGQDREKDTEADIINGTSDDLRLEMEFNRLGHTICTYVTGNDTSMIYGSSAAEYTEKDGQSPANNKLLSSSSVGMTAVNLLPDGSMELDTAANWNTTTTSVTNAALFSDEENPHAKTGTGCLRFWRSVAATETATSWIKHTGITLEGGKTYTLSAYAKANDQAIWGENGKLTLGIYPNGGNDPICDEVVLRSKPNSNIENGWQRVSMTFTPETDGMYQIGFSFSDFQGLMYVDDIQVEAASAPSTYNLVQNGSFEYGLTHWSFASATEAVLYESTSTPFGDKVVRINAKENEYIRMQQNIPLNCSSDTTFLFSGWARGSSAPNPSSEYGDSLRYFGMILRINYSDTTTEFHSVPFEAAVKDWQYTAKSIVPKEKNKTITSVNIFCAYDNNHNKAYFDNISLRMEPVRRYEYDENGKPETSKETGIEKEGYHYEGADLMNYTSSTGVEYEYTHYEGKHAVHTASVDGVTTIYTYDDAGNGTGSVMVDDDNTLRMESSAIATQDKNHTRHIYDANGNLVSYSYGAYSGNVLDVVTYPDRNYQTGNYGMAVTVINEYDDWNNRQIGTMQGILGREANGDWIYAAQLVYDYTNGRHSSTQRKSTVNGGSESWQKYTYEKNAWGQKTAVTVSRGTAKDNYTGSLTLAEYVYAANNGNRIKEYYGSADAAGTDYAEFTYDILDRITRIEYNSGRYICNTYNAEGNLAGLTYGDGAVVKGRYTFEYDSLGRPIRSYEYDGSGNLIQSIEQLYDEHSRLTEQNWVVGTTPYSESYTYNDPPEEGETVPEGTPKDGSPATVTTATGDILSFTYDALKRPKQVQATNEYGTPIINTRYAYRSSVNSEGAPITTNQIQFHNVRIGDETDSVLVGGKYTYDGVDNITEIAQSTAPYNPLVRYEYDDYNQLIKETYYDGNGNGDNNITIYYEYTYDTAGNILTVSENGTQTKSYSYTNPAWQDMLTSVTAGGTTHSLQYDGIGNPITYGNGEQLYTNLTWENGRQLTSLTTNGRTYTYDYDSEGIRTQKVINGVPHSYITQNGKVVRETIGTGSTAKILDFIYDNNGQPYALKYYSSPSPVAIPRTFHYILNLQGDVVKLVEILSSTTGIFEAYTVANYTYNAWGEILSSTGEMAELNPLRYRGYYYDSETGFYYLQSRYYDPMNRRFINADCYTSTGQGFLGYNMFAYCNNCPVICSDHSGHISKYSSVALFDGGGGEIDCYVYTYTYSKGKLFPKEKTGKVYIYTNLSSKEELLEKEKPKGFNSSTDIMVAYLIEADGNPVMFAANAHKVDKDYRANVIKCLLKFDRHYNTEWDRTEESLLIEWEGHHKWRLASSAKHIDFDNNEEGMPLEYYDEKAYSRIEEFFKKFFRRDK